MVIKGKQCLLSFKTIRVGEKVSLFASIHFVVCGELV